MRQPAGKLVMRVTICAATDRELYAALLGIKAPRSRASRLKALSSIGLRAGDGSLRPASIAADHHVPAADGPGQPPTIHEMLSWDDE